VAQLEGLSHNVGMTPDAATIYRNIEEVLSKGPLWTKDARRVTGVPVDVWREVARMAQDAGYDVNYIDGVRLTVKAV
jgi:hypothetical protein